MAFLHLPLTLSANGFFERAATEENTAGSRLRLFICSGAGEYLRLPTMGIRALWMNLLTIGVSARLCDVLRENERRDLEELIKQDVNAWLGDSEITVTQVTLLGDEQDENGIKFRTEGREFVFTFHYMRSIPNSKSSIGPWQIKESSYAVF